MFIIKIPEIKMKNELKIKRKSIYESTYDGVDLNIHELKNDIDQLLNNLLNDYNKLDEKINRWLKFSVTSNTHIESKYIESKSIEKKERRKSFIALGKIITISNASDISDSTLVYPIR